jgi:hypothetical protein
MWFTSQLQARHNLPRDSGKLVYFFRTLYTASHDLGSILQDLIPGVILSKKSHTHMSLSGNGYVAVRIYSKLCKAEK